MKKFITTICIIFCFTTIFAESPNTEKINNADIRYQLFPTQIGWTFLKLDTLTGKIWKVKYSLYHDEYRSESILSSKDITEELKLEKIMGRYTLYATAGKYCFILLDQVEGYTYQVQLDYDIEKRVLIPISQE